MYKTRYLSLLSCVLNASPSRSENSLVEQWVLPGSFAQFTSGHLFIDGPGNWRYNPEVITLLRSGADQTRLLKQLPFSCTTEQYLPWQHLRRQHRVNQQLSLLLTELRSGSGSELGG